MAFGLGIAARNRSNPDISSVLFSEKMRNHIIEAAETLPDTEPEDRRLIQQQDSFSFLSTRVRTIILIFVAALDM